MPALEDAIELGLLEEPGALNTVRSIGRWCSPTPARGAATPPPPLAPSRQSTTAATSRPASLGCSTEGTGRASRSSAACSRAQRLRAAPAARVARARRERARQGRSQRRRRHARQQRGVRGRHGDPATRRSGSRSTSSCRPTTRSATARRRADLFERKCWGLRRSRRRVVVHAGDSTRCSTCRCCRRHEESDAKCCACCCCSPRSRAASRSIEPDVGELRAGVCKPEDSDPEHDVSFKDDVLPLFERTADKGRAAAATCPRRRRADRHRDDRPRSLDATPG